MESIFKLGILLNLVDMVSGPAKSISRAMDTLQAKAEKLGPTFDRFHDYGGKIAAVGIAASIGIGVAVHQFADLEEAQLSLRTTLMDSAGKVSADYEKLNRLSEQLGTSLPGSTKDMVGMFIALREQGVQTNRILDGMGEAAAKFAALMKLGFAESATHVAKFSESMGVADQDMVNFMDLLQRLKYASGVEVGDLAYTFKYAGGSLKLLGLQGLESARDFSAIVGILAAAGIEGSTAGTNIAQAFSRMAEIGHKLDQGQIAKLVGPILDKYSIRLNFFTETGEFKGLRPMIAELEKLQALNPQEQIITLKKLFGDDASRAIAVLLKSGVAGYDDMFSRIQRQAAMETKINEIMSGTKMKWETLTGTVANFVAHVGGAFSQVMRLPAVFDRLNDMVARLDSFILANPRTAGVIAGIALALTAVAIGGGGLLFIVGGLGMMLPKIITGLSLFPMLFTMLRTGFLSAAAATWSFTTALLANPVTWIVIGIVALTAALVWLYNRFEKVRTAIQFFNFFIGWLLGNLAKLVTLNGWLNLFDSGRKLILTLVAGIKSMAAAPVEAIKGIFAKVRNLLPFSDAKEGPLSQLTLSGARIMSTLGAGIQGAAPGLQRTMAGALAGVALTTSVHAAPGGQQAAGNGRQVVIKEMHISIQQVNDANDFVRQLQALVGGYDGN